MSDIKGGGQHIKISPSINWVAFEKNGKSFLALWDTEGKNKIKLPLTPQSITGMTDKSIPVSSNVVPISQSPVYVTFPSNALTKLKVLRKIAMLPEEKHKLDYNQAIIPESFRITKGCLIANSKIKLGTYSILLQKNSKWLVQPIEISKPVDIKVLQTEWNKQKNSAQTYIEVASALKKAANGKINVLFANGKKITYKLAIAPRQKKKVIVKLGKIAESKRYKGKIRFSIDKPFKWHTEDNIDFTMLSCPVLKFTPNQHIWNKIKSIDFSEWDKKLSDSKKIDCSASYKMASTPEGLCLQVIVKDDEQFQKAWWSNMWKDDSIQIAFDMDTDKPWQANNVGYGLMGHRVTEYSISMKDNGNRMAWRHRAYAPGLKCGPPFDILNLQFVSRNEKQKTTFYNLMIPWKSLGLNTQPQAGTRIGFTIVVNDKDKGKKRRFLKMFGGIASGKDPKDFGKVLFTTSNLRPQKIKFGGINNLAYFADKVRRGKNVVIGFFGGSITHGVGASKFANNYYWKTRCALKNAINKFGAKVKFYNAAIGGTGSAYGAYRIREQMLKHKPDLLIIEFAVNDKNDPEAADNMECLVRKALKVNPKMGILFFYTSNAEYDKKYFSKGLLPPAVLKHHKTARHYGIAEVLCGKIMKEAYDNKTFTSKTFYRDGVHPLDLGHAFYADILSKALLPVFKLPPPLVKKKMPAIIGNGKLLHAELMPIKPISKSSEWYKYTKHWNWHGVPIWICKQAGKSITFKARGSNIQLLYQGSIKVEWSVKGKKYKKTFNGGQNMPCPASWLFPANISPENCVIKVTAVKAPSGVTKSEIWGLFYLKKQ